MKFICTKELGRLSKWLRILGFDTVYFTRQNMGSLIIEALKDNRAILTRRLKMPQNRGVKIINIKEGEINKQIAQALSELKLKADKKVMFTRCIICNTLLEEIEKEKVKTKVPEYVFDTQDNFVTCPKCRRIYWQGTHWGKVAQTLEKIA